jgi:hypothetical protein
MSKLNIAFAVALTIGLGTGVAHAEQFADTKHKLALEIIDSAIPGADKFVFYCTPLQWCNGERMTGANGKNEVTFQYGNKSTIRFWPAGKNYRLDHVNGKTGKVDGKFTLKPQKSPATPIPDLTLFNPNWGPAGTRVEIAGGKLNYCFSNDPCMTGDIKVVGDLLVLAEIGYTPTKAEGFLLIGRAQPTKDRREQYSVSFHRSDGQSFQSPFIVETDTTAALNK